MEGSGNAIYYAQHATATCCRRCVEYWHGIRRGRKLTEREVGYLAELVMVFVRERVPWVDAGEERERGGSGSGSACAPKTAAMMRRGGGG